MVKKPSISGLTSSAGISQSYASEILSGVRRPSRKLAIRIFRSTGWRHDSIADLTDDQIRTLETVEPWVPRAREQENAA